MLSFAEAVRHISEEEGKYPAVPVALVHPEAPLSSTPQAEEVKPVHSMFPFFTNQWFLVSLLQYRVLPQHQQSRNGSIVLTSIAEQGMERGVLD